MVRIFSWSFAVQALLGAGLAGHSHASLPQHDQQPLIAPAKRVAIIGAGAGGSSTAYHLQQFASAANIPLNITVFERNSYIGGRTTTVNAWDSPAHPVELGGSIFVSVNKILVDAAAHFNLNVSSLSGSRDGQGDEPPAPTLGVWNGEEFVYQQSAKTSFWWDLVQLLWKYGYAPIKTNNLMKSTVGKFLKMYDAPHFPWKDLSQTAFEVGLTGVTALTGEQFLMEQGVGGKFAREIIQASTRVNYAQNLPLIHGLETMVCMAAQGAMAVQGGNWQIFASMLSASSAHIHLNTSVLSIEPLQQNHAGYQIKYQPSSSASSSTVSTSAPISEHFDTVILATPHQFSNITLPPSAHGPSEIPYVQLHVTLFSSPRTLHPPAFNLDLAQSVPRTILTTLLPSENPGPDPHYVGKAPFFSISRLRQATNPHTGKREYLYKVFSPQGVEDIYLMRLLGVVGDEKSEVDAADMDGAVSWIHRKVWHSYPYMYPRVTFEPVGLDAGLWYTSGIESFISTMETSALSGKNVARLAVDGWTGAKEDRRQRGEL